MKIWPLIFFSVYLAVCPKLVWRSPYHYRPWVPRNAPYTPSITIVPSATWDSSCDICRWLERMCIHIARHHPRDWWFLHSNIFIFSREQKATAIESAASLNAYELFSWYKILEMKSMFNYEYSKLECLHHHGELSLDCLHTGNHQPLWSGTNTCLLFYFKKL